MRQVGELHILYVGVRSGTCLQRAEGLRSLGHRVTHVPAETPPDPWRFQLYRVGNRLGRPPDLMGANRSVLAEIRRASYDVLWVDKGRSMRPGTLAAVRRISPSTVQIAYSPDDMMNPGNQSPQYLRGVPLYDLHVTTKTYNVAELKQLGAREVFFVDNAYDPETHRPVPLSEEERRRFQADVGFVGGYEADRAAQMRWLVRHGVPVTVWGYHWDRLDDPPPGFTVHDEMLEGLDFARSICGTRINLGFLRKVNRDVQTTRSIEIPACGAFMLAERTDEHLGLFEEGKEAEFFSSSEELLSKCRYYLEHEEERKRIALAGRRRCITGGYSNAERLSRVLAHALSPRRSRAPAASS